MKQKIQKFLAGMLSIFLLTGGLPVQAAYESPEEIALTLKPVSGGRIPEENVHQIYVSPKDAKYGTTLHFGLWFETDPAIVDIAGVNIKLECEGASFVESSFHTPSSIVYPDGQEFTHTDGTVFTTKFQPYCFGRINNMGKYEHGSAFCTANVQEHNLNYVWNYDLNNQDENGNKLFTTKFFGDASDAYSFAEFDIQIAPDTPAGTYPVSFVTNPENLSQSTYLTSDDSYPDVNNPPYYISVSSEMIPTLYGAEIIVERPPQLETAIAPVFRTAEDTNDFSLNDFPEEVTISESGVSRTVKTEELVSVFETGSPNALSMEEPSKILQSELVFDEVTVQDDNGNPAVLEYWIAHKGDVNLDGVVNAKDAALILVYAADAGAGNDAFLTESHDDTEEQFAYFLADIDGEGKENSPLNAMDAARILIYAAMQGSGNQPDWNEIA